MGGGPAALGVGIRRNVAVFPAIAQGHIWRPFSSSVAHYISHYVFTHIWPIRPSAAPVEVRYTSSAFTPAPTATPHPRAGAISARPGLHLALVSPSLHLSTCPPPPMLPRRRRRIRPRPRCCHGYRCHCVPGCQVTARRGDDQES